METLSLGKISRYSGYPYSLGILTEWKQAAICVGVGFEQTVSLLARDIN